MTIFSNARVYTAGSSLVHNLSKPEMDQIKLLKGQGVEGESRLGRTVKHRSRVKRDPTALNLRQVHLIRRELFHELKGKGFNISSGQMEENITTSGMIFCGSQGTRFCELEILRKFK